MSSTTSRSSVLRVLLDPGDNDPEGGISDFDWDEGGVSTGRARLKILEDRGWIQAK